MSDEDEDVADLAARVDALDERVGEHDLELAAVRTLIYTLASGDSDDYDNLVFAAREVADRIDELEAENANLRTRLDRLGDIGEQKTNKEQKIAAIVTYADNRRGNRDAQLVKPGEIEGATGVGERYAYDLVDHMIHGDGENGTIGPDGYDWAHDPSTLSRRVDQSAPDKGVVIDFEGVHGSACPLNEFNNATAEMGVAD